MWIPAFRAARSFKNGAAPGNAYVQPRIGWYLWLYGMCIVARRDFVLSLVGVKGTVCECNRSRGTNLTSELAHVPRHHKSRPRLGQGSEVHVGVHARKRHVSTMRANVYVVSDWCGARSFDPCVRFRTGHVPMLVVVP